MNSGVSENVAVGVVAALGAIVNAGLGMRARRCDPASAVARFTVASVLFIIGILVFFAVISAAVGYGLLCLALVSVFLFDLLREERTRTRRIASLTPRPPADTIPSVWVAIVVLSLAMLAPYVILGEQRLTALLVGGCASVMAAIAWRIASAPIRLEGSDLAGERLRNRAARSQKAGLTAVLAVGSIFVFISFVNAELPAVLPLQRTFLFVSLATWAGMWAWVTLYVRVLDGLKRPTA